MLTVEAIRKILGKRPGDDDVGALIGAHLPAPGVDSDAHDVLKLLLRGFERGKSGEADSDDDDANDFAVEDIEDTANMIGAKVKVVARMYSEAVLEGRLQADKDAVSSSQKPKQPRKPRESAAT